MSINKFRVNQECASNVTNFRWRPEQVPVYCTALTVIIIVKQSVPILLAPVDGQAVIRARAGPVLSPPDREENDLMILKWVWRPTRRRAGMEHNFGLKSRSHFVPLFSFWNWHLAPTLKSPNFRTSTFYFGSIFFLLFVEYILLLISLLPVTAMWWRYFLILHYYYPWLASGGEVSSPSDSSSSLSGMVYKRQNFTEFLTSRKHFAKTIQIPRYIKNQWAK
jgi:hypothetical protein